MSEDTVAVDGPTRGLGDTSATLLVRVGRGRVGGSTGLDFIIQRARAQGRRVKPLDSDLRSRTLSLLYPAKDEAGNPIPDGATAPMADELPDIKEWLSGELDAMAEDGISRVLDLSGGDRVMQEYVRDLRLEEFCRRYDIGLTVAVFLGPEAEDFRHAVQLLGSDGFSGGRLLLVLNEGVIRQGQTTAGAFDAITSGSEFKRLVDEEDARVVFMQRLTCLSVLRERGIRFGEVLTANPIMRGSRLTPTLHFMTEVWIKSFEANLAKAGAIEWLP